MTAIDEMSVAKMNAALQSMEQQPDTVCTLFAAMTAAGVVPDLESYERVVKACLQQGREDCGLALYHAAEAQGVTDFQHLLKLFPEAQRSPERARKPALLVETPVLKKEETSPHSSTTRETRSSLNSGSPDPREFTSPSVSSASLSPSAPSTAASPQELRRRLQEAEERKDVPAAQKVLASLMEQPKGQVEPQELSAVYARVVALSQQVHGDEPRTSEDLLLEQAVKSNRYDKAWQLVSQMLKNGQKIDKFQISVMLKTVGKGDRGLRGQAKRHLELMEKFLDSQREDADEVLFNSLLDACCRLNDLPRLEQTLQKMKSFAILPSPSTFGTLLKAYGAKGDGASVLRVWQEMQQSGVALNPITAGCMLDACVKCGHYTTAEEVFNEVKAQGLHRNTILFTTLIKGYSRQKKLPAALKAREDMIAENVPLNVVTYNSLIDVAIRCKDLTQATTLVTQMQEDDINPDLITYSTLMKGFCEQGDLQVALELLTHLRGQNIKPDEIFYNSLLEGCVKAQGLPPSAALRAGLELFGQMLSEKCVPSNITFSILVKLYSRGDQLDAALRLVQTMEHTFHVKPTNVVFSTLVKCCVAAGRAQAAGTLLLGLPLATKLKPDQGMYATVLPVLLGSVHATVRDLELAGELMRGLVHAAPCKDAKPPCFVSLATQLMHKVTSIDQFEPRARELKEATKRILHFLVLEQVLPQQAADELLWAEPEVKEFVPGQAWAPESAWEYEATHSGFLEGMDWGNDWMEWAWAGAEPSSPRVKDDMRLHCQVLMSPERKVPTGQDENSSPNIMQILLAKSPQKESGQDLEPAPQLPLAAP